MVVAVLSVRPRDVFARGCHYLEPSDSGSSDELAIVEFYSLQTRACHEVIQRGISYERAIIELQDG